MSLVHHRVVITGASQGLGFSLAQYFLQAGASVAICARDPVALEKSAEILRGFCLNEATLFAQVANVADREAIESFITQAHATLGGIDSLIANAGIYGPKGPLQQIDWEAWCEAIDVNLKGTVLSCRTVLPLMIAQKKGKIIIISGGGATKPMPYLTAYAATKAAIVRFAESLAGEVASDGIDVNCVAPGALNTRLLDEIIAAGPQSVGEAFYQQALVQQANGGTAMTIGCALCAYLVSSESDGITGRLLSAPWDPWKNLEIYRAALMQSDIYTLRRILPDDRDLIWT